MDAVFLDVYLILYDMLNDDDDEIRDVAATIASSVMSYSSVSPDLVISLASVNASDLLATFIAQNYPTSRPLCNNVLQYLSGQQLRVSGPSTRQRLTPVSELVPELRKESTVLFVEEKQNLFIDEIREVEIWAKELPRLAESAYAESVLAEVSTWVVDGLAYFCQLLAVDAGRDGLLGWTSKGELFTLGVRVISIAGVLASDEFHAQKLPDHHRESITKGLRGLVKNGERASLHQGWIVRAQTALEGL